MNENSTPESGSLMDALRSSWALLLGFGILMLGDGLQATLLAVRADQEGFSTTTTGFVMSAFYVGFLGGSLYAPRIMTRVGHIRVFAALAALASAAILVHAVFISPWVWSGLRLISGFSFAGLYVVAESWLNDSSSNQSRGKVLSMYMLVTYIGVAVGQLFLNLGDPQDFPLFILSSVLISLAVVPLLLSAGPAPQFRVSASLSLPALLRISPLGVVGIFSVGLVTAAFFALGPVYGQRIGLDIPNISLFMTAAVIGTILLQWPIGALSDRFDRRRVVTLVTLLTAVAAGACVPAAEISPLVLMVAVGVFGGLAFPLYALCIAHTNDHLQPQEMIAASASLVLIGGLGAVTGPLLIAAIMDRFGNSGFFWSIAIIHAVTGLFALFRMLRKPPPSASDQGPFTPTTLHPTSSSMDFNTEDNEK
ncbi:MAG: MFS transporter [Pseudomonadota bacterium]